MRLQVVGDAFSICKVEQVEQIDFTDPYCFVSRTDSELSLVCSTSRVPAQTIAREDGWRAFRIEGVLDFSLIGVLAELSAVLANERIGIFVVSTYQTDYILTKAHDFRRALRALETKGYCVNADAV